METGQNNLNLDKVDGISYTVYIESGMCKAFVCPDDGTYSHRDFLLGKMAESKESGVKCDFTSCGVLAYDPDEKAWFPTFETSYCEKRTALEKRKDLYIAIKQAQETYGENPIMMAHLSRIGVQKIAHQRKELDKLGLSQEQVNKIVLKNAQMRNALSQR